MHAPLQQLNYPTKQVMASKFAFSSVQKYLYRLFEIGLSSD